MNYNKNNSNNTLDRRRKMKITAMMKSIGWVSVLLSISGVTGFVPDVSMFHVKPSTFSTRHNSRSCAKVLRPQRCERNNNVQHGTRLFYLDSNDEQQSSNKDSNEPRWLSSIVKPERAAPVSSSSTYDDSDDDETKQKVVDDYLEFLDKRYKQLHPKKDNGRKNIGPTFNALEWLRQTTTNNNKNSVDQDCSDSDDEGCFVPPEQQDDALYALGVAGLASERLLQKHHLPVKGRKSSSSGKRRMDDGVVVDATATVIDSIAAAAATTTTPSSPVTELAVNFLKVGDTVLKRAQSRREALIAYQTRQAKSLLYVIISTLASLPKKIVELWKMGGGKKTLTLAVSVTLTLVVLLKPLVHMFVQDAANNASSGSIHP